MLLQNVEQVTKRLGRYVLGILTAMGAFMLILTWVHIFYRYVLNNSLSWTEEALKILLVWFCLISASVLAAEREHVKIVIFKEKLAKRVEQKVDLMTQFVTFAISLLVMIVGIIMTINSANNISPALGLPMPFAYAAVPFAFALMTLYEFRNLLIDWDKYKQDRQPGSKYQPTPEEIQSGLHE
jgi:TRAP-type C4-dicarboxylate transport system permease small subunit